MWPMVLDMSRDECKRILRRLELEAYASLVSALRAQGELSEEKRKLLQDIAATLNISMERHKAEVRRAVNDEKLSTIAQHIAGPHTATDWAIEGRRLMPLMPRLVPQTAFTLLANNMANFAAAENAKLSPPSETAKVKGCDYRSESPRNESNVPASDSPQSSVSPVTNVSTSVPNVSPSSKVPEVENECSRKRRRSSSSERNGSEHLETCSTQVPLKISNITQQQKPQLVQKCASSQQTVSKCVPVSMNLMPVKISLPSTPNRISTTTSTTCTTTTTTAHTLQKVIIVSGSSGSGSPSILQRSLSVPVVKSMATPSSNPSQSQRPASIFFNSQSPAVETSSSLSSTVSNIVTVSSNASSNCTFVTSGPQKTVATNPTFVTSHCNNAKIRSKSVQLTGKLRSRSGSIIIPVTPHQVPNTTSPPSTTSNAKSSINVTRPCGAMKQDSLNMKFVPINANAGAKILPKSTFSSNSQCPVYVMNSTSGISMVTRTVSSSPSTKVMSISSTSIQCSNTAPVHRPFPGVKIVPKPMQAVHITSQGSSIGKPGAAKPNVIVLQKPAGPGLSKSISLSQTGKEMLGKYIVGKTVSLNSGQSSISPVTLQKPTIVLQSGSPNVSNTGNSPSHGNVIVLDLNLDNVNKGATVLTEIVQTSGCLMTDKNSNHCDRKDQEVSIQEVEMPQQTVTATPFEFPQNCSKAPNDENSLEPQVQGNTRHDSPISINQVTPDQNQSEEEISQQDGLQEIVEMIGELDPQTGIFSIHPAMEHKNTETENEDTLVVNSSSSSNVIDMFNTALTSAEISLHSLEYVDDESRSSGVACDEDSVSCSEPSATVDTQDTMFFATSNLQNFVSFPCSNDKTASSETAVFVEPTHIDTSAMVMEDFTSQKIQSQEIT